VPTSQGAAVAGGAISHFETADSVRQMRAALEATARRLRLALDAGRMATWEWDAGDDRIRWSEGHERLFGEVLPEEDRTFEGLLRRVHPADRPALRTALDDALRTDGLFEHEYRLLRSDGTRRWVLARGTLEIGDDGRPEAMTGVLADIGNARSAQEQIVAALDALTEGVLHVDRDLQILYVNREATRLVRMDRSELVGKVVWDAFGISPESKWRDHFRRAVTSPEPIEFIEHHRPLDTWFEVRAFPNSEGVAMFFRDVTDRMAAMRLAEQSRARLQFLAEASAVLDASLDYATTLSRVARLLVPLIGDLSVIDMVESGELRRLAVVAADPGLEAALIDLRKRWPLRLGADHPVARVIASGRAELITPPSADTLDPEEHAAVGALGVTSSAVVPLIARGRVLGCISVASVHPGRTFGPAELDLLTDLGRRAGTAIDNARLYREQAEVARRLQADLLPADLPAVTGLDVGARYVAAGAAQVGGDFYDLFPLPGQEPRWMFAIGDVSGRGLDAASTTGLVRHTIRAVAGLLPGPGEVIAAVNRRLVAEPTVERFCTLLVGTVTAAREPTVTLALGGHPLPLIAGPAGARVVAGGLGPFVGAFEGFDWPETVIRLEPGESLVCVTDGVLERRHGSRFLGQDGLLGMVAGLACLTADEIAERIQDAVVAFGPEAPTDDMAVLVLRVPQEGGA
jgi:PAS domain-containing protein/GAF domain-containing protein